MPTTTTPKTTSEVVATYRLTYNQFGSPHEYRVEVATVPALHGLRARVFTPTGKRAMYEGPAAPNTTNVQEAVRRMTVEANLPARHQLAKLDS